MTNLDKEESYYRLIVLLASAFLGIMVVAVSGMFTSAQPENSTELVFAVCFV